MKNILAAGFALALVVFAWQAGAGVKSAVNPKVSTAHQPSAAEVITLRTAWGNVVCKLGGSAYACSAPQVTAPPALYTTAKRALPSVGAR